MKYEVIYNRLITQRNSMISESAKAKSTLECELHILKAEFKLYEECYIVNALPRYEDLKFEANRNCIDKQIELESLEGKVEDATREIETLKVLIERESLLKNNKIN